LSIPRLSFPNENYRTVLTRLVEYFREYHGVHAIVLTGSLARGKAVKGSCIDLFVFLRTKHLNLLASTINSRTRRILAWAGKSVITKAKLKAE
jgi:predicted nucleotidyltransferase